MMQAGPYHDRATAERAARAYVAKGYAATPHEAPYRVDGPWIVMGSYNPDLASLLATETDDGLQAGDNLATAAMFARLRLGLAGEADLRDAIRADAEGSDPCPDLQASYAAILWQLQRMDDGATSGDAMRVLRDVEEG